jgi:Transposase DDE domain
MGISLGEIVFMAQSSTSKNESSLAKTIYDNQPIPEKRKFSWFLSRLMERSRLAGHKKNSLKDKTVKNKPLSPRQLARNKAISKVRFVVEHTFGDQQRWFGGKILRYQELAKAHAQQILLAVAYNLRRLPRLYIKSLLPESL